MPSYEPASVVVLGLSHFEKKPSHFSFFIYFIPIINTIYSKTVNFQVILDFDTNMRILKETEGNCTFEYATDLKYQYLCNVYEDTVHIKSMKILPDFKFISQDIDIIGISPLFKMLMNDLLSYDNRYNVLSNSTVYLMDNSTYEIYNKLLFNITGIINGTQPKLENKDISLMINLQSEQNLETELGCVIDKIGLKNYLLNCKSNKSAELNLQSAVSVIDNNDILIINFNKGANTIVELNDTKSYNRFFFSTK